MFLSVFFCDTLISDPDSFAVSYTEFLNMFRQNRTNLYDMIVPGPTESVHSGDESLVGLDAKIPGGKFDSSRSGA